MDNFIRIIIWILRENGPVFNHLLISTRPDLTTEVWYFPVKKCNSLKRNILIIVNSTYFSQCLQKTIILSILTRWSKFGLVEIRRWSTNGPFALNVRLWYKAN